VNLPDTSLQEQAVSRMSLNAKLLHISEGHIGEQQRAGSAR
jgi:hypothetical protein